MCLDFIKLMQFFYTFLFLNFYLRHYLLDLMRVTPRDANFTGPGSRFCILRPELITAFCQVNLWYSDINFSLGLISYVPSLISIFALLEKAQAADRSKSKSEGDAQVVTTDSSEASGGAAEQVRMGANKTAAFDCH